MKVVANSFEDPTRAEELVQKAYKERYFNMLKENESRKLTKEQRKLKIKQKYENDWKKECKQILFRLNGVPSKKQLFQLRKNAKKFCNSGFVCYSLNNTKKVIILIEGGNLTTRKMRRVIENRIKWKDEQIECKFLWEGLVKKKLLKRFNCKEFPLESDVKNFLESRGLLYYWNFACYSNINKLN